MQPGVKTSEVSNAFLFSKSQPKLALNLSRAAEQLLELCCRCLLVLVLVLVVVVAARRFSILTSIADLFRPLVKYFHAMTFMSKGDTSLPTLSINLTQL